MKAGDRSRCIHCRGGRTHRSKSHGLASSPPRRPPPPAAHWHSDLHLYHWCPSFSAILVI